MSVTSINGASAAYAIQSQQSKATPPQKPTQAKPVEDSVQLSKTAQAALSSGGDTDHDGDSH
jgi:hypothetical protein